jgi:hypothetical protein
MGYYVGNLGWDVVVHHGYVLADIDGREKSTSLTRFVVFFVLERALKQSEQSASS